MRKILKMFNGVTDDEYSTWKRCFCRFYVEYSIIVIITYVIYSYYKKRKKKYEDTLSDCEIEIREVSEDFVKNNIGVIHHVGDLPTLRKKSKGCVYHE